MNEGEIKIVLDMKLVTMFVTETDKDSYCLNKKKILNNIYLTAKKAE